jgi:hypothetical protein
MVGILALLRGGLRVEEVGGGEAEAVDGGLGVGPVFGEELLAFGLEEEGTGSGGDEHAAAAAGFDDALVDQLLVALEDGEGVDALFGGDGADGGQGFALLEEAVEDHGDDAASKLAIDWLGVVPLVHGGIGSPLITVVVDYNSAELSRGS